MIPPANGNGAVAAANREDAMAEKQERMARRAAALCVFAAAMTAGSVLAAQRTFVSAGGNDANTAVGCSLASPCRSFAAAMGQTTAGGEVIVLDSAGYGQATITQSVSIVAPAGVYAGVSVFSGDGITISAGAGDAVVLRGLVITGLGGANGVVVNSAGTVDLGRLEISGFSNDGISFAGASRLVIRDSIVRRNGANGLNVAGGLLAIEDSSFEDNNNIGVLVNGAAGSIAGSMARENPSNGILAQGGAVLSLSDCRVTRTLTSSGAAAIRSDGGGTILQIARCEVEGYARGFHATNGGSIQVVDSTGTGPAVGSGFFAEGASSQVDAERSSAINYIFGFRADSGGTLRMSACTASGGVNSLFNGTGTLYSRQNNTASTPANGTITPLSPL